MIILLCIASIIINWDFGFGRGEVFRVVSALPIAYYDNNIMI